MLGHIFSTIARDRFSVFCDIEHISQIITYNIFTKFTRHRHSLPSPSPLPFLKGSGLQDYYRRKGERVQREGGENESGRKYSLTDRTSSRHTSHTAHFTHRHTSSRHTSHTAHFTHRHTSSTHSTLLAGTVLAIRCVVWCFIRPKLITD